MKRHTVQRQIVLNALKNLCKHPSIEEIYAVIHGEHPSISKTTVYRNLRQLTADGLIRQVLLPDGLERYDGQIYRHYHFRCKNCGVIFDVEIEYLSSINNEVMIKYGFHVDDHDVVFLGICLNCSDKKNIYGGKA